MERTASLIVEMGYNNPIFSDKVSSVIHRQYITDSCGVINFHLGGYCPGSLRTKVLGFMDEDLVGAVLPEAEAVCRHCSHILTAETIKI